MILRSDETRWPKGEVDRKRVKKSGHPQLTFNVSALSGSFYLLQFSFCVHDKTANLPIQFLDNQISSLFKF